MPTISVFFDIITRRFYRDHNPRHFHAEHQGQNATFDFDDKLLEGEIDSRTAPKLRSSGQPETTPGIMSLDQYACHPT
jgi:hypothetical protein